MRAPRLAVMELRRFGRGRLPRAAMAAMLLLPLLYGALYLWSFWNPYDRLDRIPVALVDQDRGARVDGDRLQAGDALVEELRHSDTFDWRLTDAADAREGVEDGRYFLSLTVPEHFSEHLASSAGDDPKTAALRVRTNDANNYIVGQLSRTVFSEVRAAASQKASRRFYDRIYLAFSTLHDRTQDAADGAGRLEDGIGRARAGAHDLADGLDRAAGGSERLKDGTRRLQTGAGKLASGAQQVADGTGRLRARVDAVAGKVRPFLAEHGDEIGAAAHDVARASAKLEDHLADLPQAARTARDAARRAADGVQAAHDELCTGAAPEGSLLTGLPPHTCARLAAAADDADEAADAAAHADALLQDHENLDELGSHLGRLHDAALELADEAPHLDEDLDAAVARIHRLDDGAHQVAAGAARLHEGLSTAHSGAAALDTGIGRLATGADTLSGGMYKLSDGSARLADGLQAGVAKIPDYDEAERDARTGVMSDPVALDAAKTHAAPNYGTGFAPYFIPLSLWVGAMVAYMLLPALNRRALAAGAPAWRVALAGWLPVAAIGAVQAAALLSVLHWGLGLQMARALGTAGFLLVVTASFTALVQFFTARFGPAGRIIVLALLMLQLTSAGGTYPVQTSPGFFNALHPWLPMSYVVDGLRHLITGGGLGPVWQACGVLAAFAACALALTAHTARRSQMWTIDRLHPEISL
ncbi:MAG TPA: YhgE/Pip domain-containing protein [Streptomyces sp.]|nr:YhgE/Pip domain-containing protein [Streptomyces sp.]